MPELVISLAILLVLFGSGIYVYLNASRQSGLNALGDTVVSTLEKAKANAMAGINGDNFGVNFGSTTGTTTFIYFEGASYTGGSPTNIAYAVPNPYLLFATTSPSGGQVIFKRLTGTPQATSTITVSDPSNPSHIQIITVGSLGDINITRQ